LTVCDCPDGLNKDCFTYFDPFQPQVIRLERLGVVRVDINGNGFQQVTLPYNDIVGVDIKPSGGATVVSIIIIIRGDIQWNNRKS
tara:strand:- start:166 stop:420 length:255 start_codon:yes stop_codon:yes gene_type:complete